MFNSRRRLLHFTVVLLAPLGCATNTGTEGKIVATINLGSGFDATLITGLVLFLDAPGDAGLNWTAQSASTKSTGGRVYTSEVKDCDGDTRNEFCVTFAENPFAGGTFTFTFSGSLPESVVMSLGVVVNMQGGKSERAAKEAFDDGTSLRFVSGQPKTVTFSIPCRVGYSCAGTIDTTPPAAPVGTGVIPQGPANNNAPIVAGTAEANTTIRIYAGDATCTATPTTGTVNDAGQFAVTVAVPDNTSTVFYGRIVDLGENVGLCTALNAAIPYIEDSTAPAAPGAPDLSAASDTGASSADNITYNATPTFTGTVEGFAMVSLYHDGGTLVGTASTTGTGAYSVTSSVLTDGVYTFTVKAQDDAGNVSDASAALSITIDTTPLSTPGAPDLIASSDTGASSTDNITGATTPTFNGSGAPASATVRLYASGAPVATTTADGTGAYTVTSSALAEGDYLFTARAVDTAGNESADSPVLAVTIDSLVDCPPVSAIARWVPNGIVYAMARRGCTIYLGGWFTRMGRFTGPGAVLNNTTGELAFADPLTIDDGQINAAIPDDAGGWYIAGYFTSVGGVPRNRLARINADGTLHAWNPNSDNGVHALAVSDGVVYAGGYFTSMGGQPRNRLAAIDFDGGLLAWNPNAAGSVYALAVSDGVIYAGGNFSSISIQPRNRLAAIDTDGGLLPWNPNAADEVKALAVSGGAVYVGGAFLTIGGQPRNRLAAIDTDGGILQWNPNANFFVYSLAVSDGVIYAGGQFSTIGGASRTGLAAIDTDGGLLPWNLNLGSFPTVYALAVAGSTVYLGGSFSSVGGSNRSSLAAVDTDGGILSWNPSASGGSIFALAVSGGAVYAGGQFTAVGGQTRSYLAAIDLDAGLLPWNPNADSVVRALAVTGSTVYAGGDFTAIDGGTRTRLAAIGTEGILLPWNPNANAGVNALAVSGGVVYAGGDFTAVGGETRNYVAAIDTGGGLLPWNPSANSSVNSLAVSGSRVYVGGTYTSISGLTRNKLAAIDADGGLLAWDPDVTALSGYGVKALAVSGGTLYAGGEFSAVGGETRNYLAAIDTDGGLLPWNPNAGNYVYALTVSGGVVYAGGTFTTMGGATTRNRLAAFATDGGQLLSWNPNASSNVYALLGSTVTVYAGGGFLTIGGVSQTNLAPIDAITGLLE
ncbi:MAG: hypothetical protein HYY84_09975 [Deltaproteobacteria bacterium]|nr:hypothetical protein [Deltaproteobacteria bacterium]